MMDEKRPDKEQKERGRKYLVTKIALLIVGAAAVCIHGDFRACKQ